MEIRCDVLIWGLWEIQTGFIINIKFGYSYAETYRNEPMYNHLSRWEKEKKYKHGKNCHKKHKHFSLFVLSVYGMLGKEALVVLSKLSQLIATKI